MTSRTVGESFIILSAVCSILIKAVVAFGRLNFECPDGFYLSDFLSAYGGDARQYNYGCSPITTHRISNETCMKSESASTADGDMYLTCKDYQYVTGVSVVDDQKQQKWTLLCCSSPQVKIRQGDCVSTAFLNQYKQPFSFSSQRQLIRKWQAMYDDKDKDRRWWLQICPFDVNTEEGTEERALEHNRFTRNAFRPSRFDGLRSPNLRRIAPYSVTSLQTLNAPLPPPDAVLVRPDLKIPESSTIKPHRKLDINDYYFDEYETAASSTKGQSGGSFFDGISKVFQDIQDGLSFAQIAFGPSNPPAPPRHPPPPPPPPPSPRPPVLPLTNLQVDKPVKPDFAFISDDPVKANTKEPETKKPEKEGGALQSLLQSIGLCAGHN